jgi:rubrerythrin
MELNKRIRGCMEVEKAVASIYGAFMKIFPGDKNFWSSLMKDEIDHSTFLDGYGALGALPDDSVTFVPSMQFIEKTLEFTGNIKRKIQTQPITLKEALEISLKLEESMVETFTNALITGKNDSFEKNVEEMLVDERGHISRIKNEMMKKGFLKPT